MAAKKSPSQRNQRPPTPRLWRDALRVELARADGPTGTALERIARIVVHNALNGDAFAMREIAERLDGKVGPQPADEYDEPLQKLIVTWEGGDTQAELLPSSRILEHLPAAQKAVFFSDTPPTAAPLETSPALPALPIEPLMSSKGIVVDMTNLPAPEFKD